MNTIDEVMTYLTTTDGAYIEYSHRFHPYYVAKPSGEKIQVNIGNVLTSKAKGWFIRKDISYSTDHYILNTSHTWKPKKAANKLTDTQYNMLHNFAWMPYVSASGSYYKADGMLADTYETARTATISVLMRLGYTENKTVVSKHGNVHLIGISPAGIAAHDTHAAARGDHNFAQAIEEYAIMREKSEATRDAKRIVMTPLANDTDILVYHAGKPDVVITIKDGLLVPPNWISPAELDDVVALLTEAKRELARRTEAR